jgi:predicted P-loop ATPase
MSISDNKKIYKTKASTADTRAKKSKAVAARWGRGNLPLATTIEILEEDARFAQSIAYNALTSHVDMLRPFPWRTSSGVSRWRDRDDFALTALLQQEFGLRVSVRHVHQAVIAVAQKYRIDPLEDYLAALEWDGTPRLDAWLVRYLGADDTRFVRAAGPRFIIGAVARALCPGSQLDTVLVLEGKQGIGKSSAVRILGSPEWTCDDLRNVNGKDAALQLRGRWFVEVPELEAMKHSHGSRINSFFSRRVDSLRPPYGRRTEYYPRRCVFIATTNEGAYLSDQTGGRRFWPVRCGLIRLKALQRDRDQLFAEAVARYREGEVWWLEPEEERLAARAQELRLVRDEWMEVIDQYVGDESQVALGDVLINALGLGTGKWAGQVQSRAVQLLILLGFEKRRVRDETGRRVWRYVWDVQSNRADRSGGVSS